MTAIKKINPITMEEFVQNYDGTRCQFHEGDVWESQPTSPDHSFLQRALGECIGLFFSKIGGPKRPGGWWIFTEVAVKYSDRNLFCHDLGGWKKARCPERPRRYPITDSPDWVCEILSTNASEDRIKKKAVLHKHEVPYYWIVDPTEKSISVLEWSPRGYVSILDVTEGFVGKIPPFDAVELKANVLFGDEDE